MQNYINYYSQLFHFSFNQEKEQVIPSLMMSYHEMLTVKQQMKEDLKKLRDMNKDGVNSQANVVKSVKDEVHAY